MTLQMVRFTTTDADVAEIETAIESMIAAINEAQPPGTRYTAGKTESPTHRSVTVLGSYGLPA